MKRTKPGQTPPIVFVVMAGAILFLVILAFAMGNGGGEPIGMPTQSVDRTVPDRVQAQVITGLKTNNPDLVYWELSPSLREKFSLDSFRTTDAQATAEKGKITNIETIEPTKIMTEPGLDGKWAVSTVRVIRERATEVYEVLFYLEDDGWYLVSTNKIP